MYLDIIERLEKHAASLRDRDIKDFINFVQPIIGMPIQEDDVEYDDKSLKCTYYYGPFIIWKHRHGNCTIGHPECPVYDRNLINIDDIVELYCWTRHKITKADK
jgi:hypothetical protein